MKILHKSAAILSFIILVSFWLLSFSSELIGGHETIRLTKNFVFYGMFLLIPSIITTAISGFKIGQKYKGRVVEAKRKRMPFIAMIGALVLLPLAIWLRYKANYADFDSSFQIGQIGELIFGGTNIYFLGKNILAGRRLAN